MAVRKTYKETVLHDPEVPPASACAKAEGRQSGQVRHRVIQWPLSVTKGGRPWVSAPTSRPLDALDGRLDRASYGRDTERNDFDRQRKAAKRADVFVFVGDNDHARRSRDDLLPQQGAADALIKERSRAIHRRHDRQIKLRRIVELVRAMPERLASAKGASDVGTATTSRPARHARRPVRQNARSRASAQPETHAWTYKLDCASCGARPRHQCSSAWKLCSWSSI